jgi:hypothetical protein
MDLHVAVKEGMRRERSKKQTIATCPERWE